MTAAFETDRKILEAIRANRQDAWVQLVARYQGRLLNFACARMSNTADAEDLVQESFTSLLAVVGKQSHDIDNLEGYLYAILRNAICTLYRTRWHRSVCLLQDAFGGPESESAADVAENLPADQASASWCVSQQEQADLQQQALIGALKKIVQAFKQKLNFRDLKLCDLLFYSRLRTREAAEIMDLNESSVRVFKHRIIKQFQQGVVAIIPATESCIIDPGNGIPTIWELCRPTCPKNSTLGKFVNEDLDPAWFDYIDFHLTTFGCHFCRASYKDLMTQGGSQDLSKLQDRILHSTIGFFTQVD